MADKKITFGFFARDNGVEKTLDKIGDATQDAARQTDKLTAGQIELREAALSTKRAEDQLGAAREKLTRVTKLAAASDQDKRRAALQVEAAEIKLDKALMGVAHAADKARKSVDDAGDAAKKAGDKASTGSKGFSDIGKDLMGSAKGAMKSGIAGLAILALAGGLAVGAALVKGVKKTLDFQDAQAKMKVQLGLTVGESKRVGEVAGKVYAGAYGENMQQVREAITSVIRNGAVMNGSMSKDLQDVTGKVLNLANTFEQDLGGVTRTVAQMIRTGMAKDAAQALDILTKGFQSGADKSEDLLDTFNEYPTQFRKLGLNGTQAMGLISQALKAGARDSDLAADALKEFSIRAVDGSKTTSDGFKALGLNAGVMASKIAAGGKSAAGGLDTVLDRLRNIKDPVERSRIAVQLFGTQAEDLGEALYKMDPSTAVAALGSVGGAADKMGQDLTTPQAKLTALKRTLELKVQSWLLKAFDWFNAHRFEIAEGALDVAEGLIAMIKPMAGVAAVGLKVAGVLTRVAAAAAFAQGNVSLGRELWDMGGKLDTAAEGAKNLGDAIAREANPRLVEMRKKLADAKAAAERLPKSKATAVSAPGADSAAAKMNAATRAANGVPQVKNTKVNATENATAVARRAQGAINGVRGRTVAINVTQQGASKVQRTIDSITGHVVEIVVGSRRTGVVGYAEGGLVTGPGGPTDDRVPAMLSNREYVMPAEQTEKFLPLLEAMRSDRVAMMAGGGMVGGRPSVAQAGRGSTVLQPIVLQLDKRTVWQGLVSLKRDVGALGLS